MSAKEQDLGIITSYGYAIKGGFVGTVEEYESYLASLPSYRNRAEAAANSAADSATSAATSASNANTSASNASAAASNAEAQFNNARTQASNAATSATNAQTAKDQAQTAANSASASAASAREDADDAHDYAQSSIQASQQSAASASAASASENRASTYATSASNASTAANTAKNTATTQAGNAANSAVLSQSWAVGGTGTRSGEDTNNAKYYCEQAQAITGLEDFVGATEGSSGTRGLVPAPPQGKQFAFLRGDGTWSNTTGGAASNVAYSNNISHLSATDVQGAVDEVYHAHEALSANVYKYADSIETSMAENDYIPFYDVSTGNTKRILKSNLLSASGVTGVKGNSETSYRSGNVNITASNIGLGSVGNFLAVSTVANQGLTSTEKTNARNNLGLGAAALKGVATAVNTSGDLITSSAVNTALANKAEASYMQKATLAKNTTSVSFTFSSISSSLNYLVDIYAPNGLAYTSVSLSGNTITATYPAQSTAMDIYCRVEEVNIRS